MEAFIPPGGTSSLRVTRSPLRIAHAPTPPSIVAKPPRTPPRRQLAMLAKRAKPPPSSAPSGPADRDASKISSILRESGFSPRTATTDLEERFNQPPSAADAPGPTLYERVAGIVGADNLAAAEKQVGVALVAFAVLFVACGVAISVEAYVKVTGGTLVVGEGLDGLVVGLAEKVFTPALVAFLVISSAYGTLKASQLGSGGGCTPSRQLRASGGSGGPWAVSARRPRAKEGERRASERGWGVGDGPRLPLSRWWGVGPRGRCCGGAKESRSAPSAQSLTRNGPRSLCFL